VGLSILPLFPDSGAHHALRESAGKTVMAVQNNPTGAGFQPSDGSGQRRALDELFSLTYEELRRLASAVSRGDPGVTLNPTALVNEAWMKMSRSPGFVGTSPLHFKRIAARAMRQILVEAARRRNANKRGGADAITVTFDESLEAGASDDRQLLALHTALEELERLEPRQAAIVESRFFGGLDVGETAALLNVSEATILRDWRAARAKLAHELRQSG
jgi:RNA polymerase sigma factor (TIGR02999 family)